MSTKVVINNTETHATVKVVGGSQTITLADIAFQGVTPPRADIKSVFYASDWNEGLEIIRNSVNVVDLFGSGFVDFQEKFGAPLQEESDQSAVVNTSGSGSHFMCIVEFVKHKA